MFIFYNIYIYNKYSNCANYKFSIYYILSYDYLI